MSNVAYEQTHFDGSYEYRNSRSYLYWSINPPKRLIIFVHGFKGASLETWHEFPRYLNGHNELADTDIVFYEYPSTKIDATQLAVQFGEFVDKLVDSPSTLYPGSLTEVFSELRQEVKYERVFVVGHSLGAIVVRLAFLMKRDKTDVWDQLVRLIFFAPAHSGARDSLMGFRVFAGLFHCLLGIVMNFIIYKTPALDDLLSNSSTIAHLNQQTLILQSANPSSYTKAILVVIAELEHVVNNTPFCQDPIPIIYLGKTHTNLCKPTDSFQLPLNDLLSYI